MTRQIRRVAAVLSLAFLPSLAGAAEMRMESPPARSTVGGVSFATVSFPDTRAGATGAVRIGQSYADVRALLLAQYPAARISVQNRRFQLRGVRTEPNVIILQTEIVAPDRSYVERLRLRFTSKMTGQQLYFIHRDVEFRRATRNTQREFADLMSTRFQNSTWSMVTPSYYSFRQIFSDGRMLSWGESQNRPELGGCFPLTGGPAFEATLDEGSLIGGPAADLARCGGGVDADWNGDAGRFTVTLIDVPMFRRDRETLRNSLELASQRQLSSSNRAQP